MSTRKVSDSTSRATSAPSGGSTVISENENLSEIYRQRYKLFILKNIISFGTLLGIFLGFTLGFTFKYSPWFGKDYWTPRRLSYVKLPGELFLSSLSCLYAPTLISSLMAAVGSLEKKAFKFVLWRSLFYISVSTLTATALGVLVVLIVNPGSPEDHPFHPICFEKPIPSNGNASNIEPYCTKDGHPCSRNKYDKLLWGQQTELKKQGRPPSSVTGGSSGNISYCSDSVLFVSCRILEDDILDVTRELFPSNIIEAFLKTSWTVLDLASPIDPNTQAFAGDAADSCLQYRQFSTNASTPSLWDYNIETVSRATLNMNGIFTFFIFLALAAVAKPESGRPTLNFVTSLSECTLKMGNWIIWLSPIFMTSLVATNILEETDLLNFPATVFYYLLTCVLALLLYSLVVLPLVYYVYLGKSPFKFYKQLLPVLFIKLGTPSSSRTFPVTIDFLETVCNLDPRVVRLVIPFGSKINLDGTAICTVVAVGYVAQLHGVDILSSLEWLMLYIFVVVLFMPGGDSHIQQDLFIRRINVGLASVRLPPEFRVYVTSIDWVIYDAYKTIMFVWKVEALTLFFVIQQQNRDRLASVTNTLSNCVGCAVIHQLSLSTLAKIDDVSAKSSVREHKHSKNSAGQKDVINGPSVPVPVPVTTNSEISQAVNENDSTSGTKSESTVPKTIQQQSNLSNDSARKKRRVKSKSSSLAKSGSPSPSMKSKYSKKSKTVDNIGEETSKPKQNRRTMSTSNNSKKDWNTSTKSTTTISRKSSKPLRSTSKKSRRSRTASKSKSKASELLATSRSPSTISKSKSKSKLKSKSKSKSKGSTN